VIGAGAEDSKQSAQSLAELCRTYWYPVYSMARFLGDAHEDAQDVTQAFFLHLLRSRLATKANPQAGKFRNFRATHRRLGRALKRGGDVDMVSLDALDAEQRFAQEAKTSAPLDQRFDSAWATAVLDQARQLLELEYAAAEKKQLFTRLISFLPGGDESSTYAKIALEVGKTVDAVKMELSRMRKRYRSLLKVVVGGTVADPSDVDEELRYLLQVLTTGQDL
jgi:DNA-directed RNA polymerase specialized sigma24 family protein